MQKLIISLSLLCWINISIAAPLNKFVAPPEDEPHVSQTPYVQQQVPSRPLVQQRFTPAPATQNVAPPDRLTLKQRWERLRLQKVEEQTLRMVDKLKNKMQTLNLKEKMKWHDKFEKKYNKAKESGQVLATGYYQKLLEVSEQLIGKDTIKERGK